MVKEINRIKLLQSKIKRVTDPEDLMIFIMDTLKDIDLIPTPGKHYTFVYIPKTPGITYDQHPLITCLEVQRWGFKGYNYHWGEPKNYTWIEVVGQLHQVRNNELSDLQNIKYAKFITK